MAEVLTFGPGGYRYLKGVFQYSAAVAAEPGMEIERARFRRPVLLAEGFDAIGAHLRALGRPLAAFCACELRSPAPFTETEFESFNRQYVEPLARWGIYRDGLNPVARSNVCPELAPPSGPSFHAFSYTVPAQGLARKSFVVAGGAEAPEGKGGYREHIVRYGDVSPAGLREKGLFVINEMERRMRALDCGWDDTTDAQLYTVHAAHSWLAPELTRRGGMAGGLTWHYARPPVVGLDFEMDVRGLSRAVVIG